jgi:hypothetical protein
VSVNIISKSALKFYLSNAEDGTQDDMLWDNSELSGEGTSSENESVTERSLVELSD